MLMAWGPFRFTVPNYSVETLRRSVQPRVAAQPVIGATPPVHRLGPGNDTITLESTFHPHHLNGRGLAQLTGIQQMVNAMEPQMLIHINGLGSMLNIFGLWIATGVEGEHTMFDAKGRPQTVTTSLTLMQYGDSGPRSLAIGAVSASINFNVSVGGFSAGIGIGF